MRSRLSFLALVALFTIFGGGRGSQWVVVVEDNAKWRYEMDLISVRSLEPEVLTFAVRASLGDHVIYDSWVLDAGQNTLTLGSNQDKTEIRSGSVAAKFIDFLKLQGRLPVAGVLPRFRYTQ